MVTYGKLEINTRVRESRHMRENGKAYEAQDTIFENDTHISHKFSVLDIDIFKVSLCCSQTEAPSRRRLKSHVVSTVTWK